MIPWLTQHPNKRCTATKKNKEQCKNPKAFGCKTCRYHGARRIKTGIKAPNYKHGEFTKESLHTQRASTRRLYELYLLGLQCNLFVKGTRMRGRPPGGIS